MTSPFFTRLLGGDEQDDPRDVQQALLRSGLRTIAGASQPGSFGLGPIAEGILGGQQDLEMLSGRRALQGIASTNLGETPEEQYQSLQRLLPQVLGRGDTESAKWITQALAQLAPIVSARALSQTRRNDENAHGTWITTMGPDGKPRRQFLRPGEESPPIYEAPQQGRAAPRPVAVDLGSGPVMAVWDADAGEFTPVEGAKPVKGQTEAQAKARAFLPSVARDVALLEDVIKEAGFGDALTGQFTGLAGQALRFGRNRSQQMSNAASTLAEAWLRMTTGAAYSQTEYENARNRFNVQVGDTPETVAWKMKNARDLIGMLQTAGNEQGATPGPAGAPSVPPRLPGETPLQYLNRTRRD